MNEYVLMTDMTCDLGAEWLDKYGIRTIPMTFSLGEKDYVHYPDQRELTLKEFYERLQAGESVKTTQINPEVYMNHFTEALGQGKDVLYLCFTSGMSGTLNTAKMAASQVLEDYPERRIVVVDSLCASIGLGLLVLLAGRRYAEGCSLEELHAYTEEWKVRCCHWFTVEDLFHLKKGGRLSSVEAIFGTALKIKPILSVDPEGKLVVVAKERGTKKAYSYLAARLENDGAESVEGTVIIGHANAPENAEFLANIVRERGLAGEVIISEIGPIIGAHVGAGMCALAFVGENYKF